MSLFGRTVVIIGAGTAIGQEAARRAKGEGAQLILTDSHTGPLEDMAEEIGVEATAAFDESDVEQLAEFLDRLPGHVDHMLFDLARARRAVDRLLLPIATACYARREMCGGGSLVFVAEDALPSHIAHLAAEAAPVRVNLITGARADDVAALAVRVMTDIAVTGAVLDLEVNPGTRRAGSGAS